MAKRRKPSAPQPAAGNDAIRAAIAEALIEGVTPEELVADLIATGTNPSSANYEVERAAGSPYLRGASRLKARLAKREWTLGIFSRLAAADPDRASIPTVDRIEPSLFYRDFYFANRPVKLTGLVDHWPAMKLWSLDFFEARLGEAMIELQWNREDDADYEIAKERHQRLMPMREVVTRMREGGASNDFYVTAYNSGVNKSALAPLWNDIGPISILAPREERDGFFWMGPKGTITPFHHDLTNNLLLQLSGRKRVKMVAAHDGALMRNRLHCFSEWSGDELGEGPAAPGRPRVFECVLGPGEALFLPIGWWHHVEGLDPTIGMSFTNFAADNDFYQDYSTYAEV